MRWTFAAALATACLVVAPAAATGGWAGSPNGELMGHAWVRWWSTLGWPDAPSGTDLASGATRWPVIDPLPNWIFSGVARMLGDAAGWNFGVACGVVVTALGGAALVRSLGGSPIFGAIALPLAPIFLGSVASGLTEDHMLGLVAFALAFALQKHWFLAAGFVGLSAWSGLYLGWFAGVSVALAAAAEVLRVLGFRAPTGPENANPAFPQAAGFRALWPPVAGAMLAALLAVSAATPFWTQLGAASAREPPQIPSFEPAWKLNPWRAADLASFVAPGKVDTGEAAMRQHPVYLGFATAGLALAGGGSPLWLGIAACAAAALGEEVVIAGHPTGVGNPVDAMARRLPFGDAFRNRARIMLLGQLLLIGLAGRGARRIADRVHAARPGFVLDKCAVSGVLALVVAAESLLVSPAPFPMPCTPDVAPGIYAAIPASDLPMRVLGSRNPQAPLFHQRAHGHRLLNDPNRPPQMPRAADQEIVVAFGDLATLLQARLGPPDATDADAAAWWP